MKRQRHREILEIISQESVETQEDLARRLRERGFEVTQATVSRDIKELRLLKVLTDEGSYRYAVAEKAEQGLTERLRRIFTETALHVDVAENLIVIKTLPGSAHAGTRSEARSRARCAIAPLRAYSPRWRAGAAPIRRWLEPMLLLHEGARQQIRSAPWKQCPFKFSFGRDFVTSCSELQG